MIGFLIKTSMCGRGKKPVKYHFRYSDNKTGDYFWGLLHFIQIYTHARKSR